MVAMIDISCKVAVILHPYSTAVEPAAALSVHVAFQGTLGRPFPHFWCCLRCCVPLCPLPRTLPIFRFSVQRCTKYPHVDTVKPGEQALKACAGTSSHASARVSFEPAQAQLHEGKLTYANI